MASSSILFGDDPDWNLIRGASLAFLSQLSSIGKGLQKVGVRSLPELSPRPRVLWQYATNPTWRTGLLLDVCGALFGLAALTIVPISVAQPIFCNGLVLLALYSHFYLKENLRRREWISIFLCFAGTLMLAATLVPRDWQRTDIRWIQVKLGLVLMLTLPLLVALELAARRAKAFSLGPSVIELLAGLQAGLCIGVGNATLASGLQANAAAARAAPRPPARRRAQFTPLSAPPPSQSTSRSWLAHLGSASDSSAMALHLLLSGFFVVSGAGLNIAHPVFANRGYQHGRVVLISTYCALFSMITGVLMGTIVLDEAWPVQWEMRLLRSLSFSLVFFGVLTLNWANICHLQSQAIKRVKSELNGIDSPPDHGGSNGAKKPARVLPGSPTANCARRPPPDETEPPSPLLEPFSEGADGGRRRDSSSGDVEKGGGGRMASHSQDRLPRIPAPWI